MKKGLQEALLGGAIIIFAATLVYFGSGGCVPVQKEKPVDGSQGYRIWFGNTLMSFEHDGWRVCIPEGWEPVGAIDANAESARFKSRNTGLLVRSDAFLSKKLSIEGISYDVTLMYPRDTTETDIALYAAQTETAFKNIASLYGAASSSPKRKHTVLVTSGVAGDTKHGKTRVYPDPNERVSMIVRSTDQQRSEELLIHALAHLYNRFGGDDGSYLAVQAPFLKEDFEELEASWSELRFSPPATRTARIRYLYNIHTAVRINTYSLIEEPPFNNEEAFNKIRQTVLVGDTGNYLDYQYGHYVLAPLAMAALETRLADANAPSLSTLLTTAHTSDMNFLLLVENALGESGKEELLSWIEGRETVPKELVDRAARLYDLP